MKVKKFPQSHLLISKDGQSLMIDPGSFSFVQGQKGEEFQNADVYLITHIHEDHMDYAHIKDVVGDKPVYGNASVISKLKELGVEGQVLEDREEIEVSGFKIKALELPHCKLVDGSDGPPNTGFLINEVFFHPGDGNQLAGFEAEKLALPIAGPSISYYHALKFAKQLNAKVVVPIHFDAFIADPEDFAKRIEGSGIKVIPLLNGEETEL